MRKILLFALLGIMAMALPLVASPVDCAATGTLADLIALNPTGCLINGLLFNSFAMTPSSTGTGTTPTAAQVGYTLDDPGLSTGTGESIYGFEFNPNLTVSGVGSEDISLTYTIIASVPEIASLHLLETAAVSGAGSSATVAEGPDRGCLGVGTGCSFLTTIQAVPGDAHQDLLGIGPFQEVDVFKDINATSSTDTGLATISQVRDSVDVVPEPATLALVGGALIGLAMIRRKRVRPE